MHDLVSAYVYLNTTAVLKIAGVLLKQLYKNALSILMLLRIVLL